MVEDMEAATRVGIALTLVTTEGIMKVISATNFEGVQEAQSQGVTSRIRILVSLRIRLGRIALSLAKSSGR
jgi:hypothetical protein